MADQNNQLIRKITSAGVVTTVAGSGSAGAANGVGTAASFSNPYAVTVDNFGTLYVADYNNNSIRKITPGGVVSTLAGTVNAANVNGTGAAAAFNHPGGVSVDGKGNLYVADYYNNEIRKINVTGYGISAPLLGGLSFDSTTGTISGTPTVVTPATSYTVTAYNTAGLDTVNITLAVKSAAVDAPLIAYAGPKTYAPNTAITPLTPTNTGGAIPASAQIAVSTFAGGGATGNTNGTGAAASFNFGQGALVTTASGNTYLADSQNHLIRKITPAGVVTTLAGSGVQGSTNGTGTAASFNTLYGITADQSGNIYVADGNVVRKITSTGVVTTFAGNAATTQPVNGTGTAASFSVIEGLASDASGNIYVMDTNNGLLRKITPAGVVTTLAGDINSQLRNVISITVDATGNIYGVGFDNQVIKITQAGVITTIAGAQYVTGFVNGTGNAASFNFPYGIVLNSAGNLLITDEQNHAVRQVTLAGVVTTYAGTGIMGLNNSAAGTSAFNYPTNISAGPLGVAYVMDSGNKIIRKIATTGYTISPALPAGLSMNANTGVISGTPTAASAAAVYTVTAYNSGGTAVTTVTIGVSNSLSFAAIPSKPYGTADFDPGATSGSAITYTSGTASVATIVSGKIHIVGVGSAVITATSNGSTANQTLTVTKALLTVTAANQTKVAGAANPTLTISYAGFKNGQTSAVFTTQPSVVTTAATSSPAGTYPITASGAVAANYSFTYVDGTLTVTAAAAQMSQALTSVADTTEKVHSAGEPEVNSAVSPNGDRLNDVLTIKNIGNFPDNKITVINRGGVKIFEQANYDNENRVFDGHSNINGVIVPAGTYFYLLEYKKDGKTKHKSGYIILKY